MASTEWDFTDSGTFAARPFGQPRNRVEVSETFAYTTPGTYFATWRVTSNRDGDPATPFAKMLNLGQVRAVVH